MATRRGWGKLRKLPSGRWQASYIGPDGQRHTAPTGTYLSDRDGEHWLAEEERLVDQGRWTPPSLRAIRATLPRLGDYGAAVIERRANRSSRPIKPTSAAYYRKLWRLTIDGTKLAELPLDLVTPAAIRAWRDGLGPRTQSGHAYALLRSILAEAVDDELIDRNPAKLRGAGRPAPLHEGVALTVDELTRYLAALPDQWAVPLGLTAWCSLRSGELRALRRCDLADDGTAVRVARTVSRIRLADGTSAWHIGTPKSAAGARVVHVPPPIVDGLAAWLAHWDAEHPGASGEELLWPGATPTTPMHDTSLRSAHKRAAAVIGKPGMTVHDLRRTGATLAAQSGATTREVMRRLGHTTAAVAMIYQVADNARDAEVAKRMGQLG